VNRRQALAPLYQDILDIFGDEIGRPVVALLDVVAAQCDENDELVSRAISIDGYEWRAEA
jgi:hypothetical protein